MRSLRPLPLVAGAVWAALASSCLAQTASDMAPPLQLAFFQAFRPGVLQQCEKALDLPAEVSWKPEKEAWPADFAFSLHWPGGSYQQNGPVPEQAGPGPGAHPLLEVCFMLLAGGKPFMSGAVVGEGSTRQLNFPTLVRMRTPPGDPARFELHPSFPAAR